MAEAQAQTGKSSGRIGATKNSYLFEPLRVDGSQQRGVRDEDYFSIKLYLSLGEMKSAHSGQINLRTSMKPATRAWLVRHGVSQDHTLVRPAFPGKLAEKWARVRGRDPPESDPLGFRLL
jgi:hypothetical protein